MLGLTVSSLWGWQARGAWAGGTEVQDQAPWVDYPYLTGHPIIRWLPSKLAEWIAENKGVDLGIAPKQGQKWSVQELNDILLINLVE